MVTGLCNNYQERLGGGGGGGGGGGAELENYRGKGHKVTLNFTVRLIKASVLFNQDMNDNGKR